MHSNFMLEHHRGRSSIVRTYWIVAGVGVLATAVGGVVYFTTDAKNGLIVILGGMVVAIMALVMALVQSAMDKSK
jgi:hypothetical protein